MKMGWTRRGTHIIPSGWVFRVRQRHSCSVDDIFNRNKKKNLSIAYKKLDITQYETQLWSWFRLDSLPSHASPVRDASVESTYSHTMWYDTLTERYFMEIQFTVSGRKRKLCSNREFIIIDAIAPTAYTGRIAVTHFVYHFTRCRCRFMSLPESHFPQQWVNYRISLAQAFVMYMGIFACEWSAPIHCNKPLTWRERDWESVPTLFTLISTQSTFSFHLEIKNKRRNRHESITSTQSHKKELTIKLVLHPTCLK